MKVSINNKEVETDAVTLLQLTTELSLPAQGVAVAANNRMIPRTEWAVYALSEGLSIVIIKAACGGEAMEKVQFITHYTERYSYLDSARMALEGGCRWIQLRMKDAAENEILPVAAEVRKLCNDYGAIFIIDDHVELVKEIRADGVHLGKNDMPVAEARRILGEEYIIGGTANTYEDVKKHWLDGVNYIGCGPFRYTTTKQKLSPILGLEGYKEIIRQMRADNINLPIIAIGGITFADIPSVMQTGVTGIALSGTVLRADNPVEEMQRILTETNQAGKINQTANY